MEESNCIICKSSISKMHSLLKDRFTGEEFRLVQCSCDFIYLNPRPTIQDIKKYYDWSNYDPHSVRKSFFSTLYERVRYITFIYKNILIKRHNKSNSFNLLDIGSGSGAFGDYMSGTGWNVTLQDTMKINSTNSMVCCVNSLDELDKSMKFDVISMWHSLEHIHDVNNLFKNIKNVSKSSTILYILIPNNKSIDSMIFKDRWVAWDAPRHLYHFSYRDLRTLLNNNEWNIYSTKTFYHDTMYNILLSIKSNKFKAIKSIFLFLCLIPLIMFNKNLASSRLYICKKR